MAERREIVNRYVQSGLGTSIALPAAGLSRSTYYYKPHPGQRGKTKSTSTLKSDGSQVTNTQVVERINEILSGPFIDYGCDRVTLALKKEGYLINKKKVYRLMKESNLLYPKKASKWQKKKEYVKYTVPLPNGPYEIVEMDIKYIYVAGEGRNAFLLTLLDTFHRGVLGWRLDYTMKAYQVRELLEKVVKVHQIRLVKIRTDNGPQFISGLLRKSLEDMGIAHEFIRPGTPEQNGHIESFHSLISKQVMNHFELSDIQNARELLNQFYEVYNKKRIMKVLLGRSPMDFLQEWQMGEIGVREKPKQKRFFFREKPGERLGSSPEDFYMGSLQIKNKI